jgi:probable phosphoglycerate mutase
VSVTRIFIARHGETEFNKQNRIQGRGINASLNRTGRKQACALARCLEEESINLIFSSGLKRSKETARIVANKLGLEVHASYPELDEMDFGRLEGKPIQEISEELNELKRLWEDGNADAAPPGGESPSAVLQRAIRCMEMLLQVHQGSNILFILHGRLIRILLSEWLNMGLTKMHRIEHCNGALYHLRLQGTVLTPVYLARKDHLV